MWLCGYVSIDPNLATDVKLRTEMVANTLAVIIDFTFMLLKCKCGIIESNVVKAIFMLVGFKSSSSR